MSAEASTPPRRDVVRTSSLLELHEGVLVTQGPETETVADQSQGVWPARASCT